MMSLAPLALVGPSTSKMFTLNASGTKPAGMTQLMIGVVAVAPAVIGTPAGNGTGLAPTSEGAATLTESGPFVNPTVQSVRRVDFKSKRPGQKFGVTIYELNRGARST